MTALLLCLCLIVPLFPAHAVEETPDWAKESYAALEDRSLLPSSSQTSGAITRGSFVELLVLLLEGTVPGEELSAYPAQEEDYFSDSSAEFLLKGASYGILEGTQDEDGNRLANENDHLTREQAAKMTCSLLTFFSETLGYPVTASATPASYVDADSISDWAKPFTGTIASYGLMRGDDAGRFDPLGELDWPSSVVMGRRILELLDAALAQKASGLSLLPLQSGTDWSKAARFGANDYSVSKPKTGWAQGYYTIDNGDGTVSALAVGAEAITVERFDEKGALVSSKTLELELPVFGAFFDSGDHFYLAFGQNNPEKDDDQEVFRVVQYDRAWERQGQVSVNGKDSYTDEPFRSAIARMAVSVDGETLALYAARKRYDGHQSNITILMDTKPFQIQKVMGQEFPTNHVSHSFGQFIQFDGEKMVTVDHGDAYPRSFVFQDDKREVDLLKIAGNTGENVTNAIGSGFEVSKDGYLFLGCSDPQQGNEGEAWNLFLAYLGKTGDKVELRWLTDSEETINCARLVKLGEDSFAALWQAGSDLHCQKLDGKGQKVDDETVLSGAVMPPTQPVVVNGAICWVQTTAGGMTCLFRLEVL